MTEIVWNEAALAAFLSGPDGPVANDLGRRAILVESATKVLLNESFPPVSERGQPPRKRSGRLQTSITWQLGRDGQGLYADIGSPVVYAERLEVEYGRPYLSRALSAGSG